MARVSSSSSQSSSQAKSLQATSPLGDLNVLTPVGATMAMPVSTETGVTTPSTVLTSSPMKSLKFTTHNIHSPSSSSIFGRNTLPVLTTDSMNLLRQQMDENNHEMVNLLTQQIGTVFNPLIRDTNRSYQALATQMGRISDFIAPPEPVYQPGTQIQNRQPLRLVQPMFQRPHPAPQP